MKNTPAPTSHNDFHFDLRHLGESHRTSEYTLKASGKAYALQRHTPQTLSAKGLATAERVGQPTHFAEAVETADNVVQLIRVYGPPNADGFPTLASVAVHTPGAAPSYSEADIAKAIVFLNPSVTVLTPEHADTVLGHITETNQLQDEIKAAGEQWNVPRPLLDGDGNTVLDPNGKPRYFYDLHENVLNSSVAACRQAKASAYSDPSLENVRWAVQPGVSHLDVSSSPQAPRGAASSRPPGREASPSALDGYHYNVQDGGPNFGVSLAVESMTDDFVLTLKLANNYIRHMSVFASFLKGDGKTAMTVPDNIWTTLLKDAAQLELKRWMGELGTDAPKLLGGSKNTLKFCGLLSSESTFMGVPVSESTSHFSFKLPDDQGPVGLVRILVGSLGVNSHNDWDPECAWIGIAMTSVIDLAIPTISLIATVGTESNTLFDSIFKDIKFLAPTALSVFLVAKDLITKSDDTGNEVEAMLTSLSTRVISRVLTASDVAAKLAAYFGAEEAEEAIPIVGWALKVQAMEGTAAQLAQTVGEVIASPRVVEFDITVTMDAEITIVPDMGGSQQQPEFAATAASYSITAQYSDSTTRTFSAPINDPKIPQLVAEWDDIPVGGTVTFVVAVYSKEGWLVGQGTSGKVANQITKGAGKLLQTVKVKEMLYPLNETTTYQHSQLLVCENGSYAWQETPQAPTETAENLGTGGVGHFLESLNGITLNADLGILGYSWQAAGLNIPPVGGDDDPNVELCAFKNIAYGPNPNAGVMDTPKGFDDPPQLVYLRTAAADGMAGAGGAASFFFLDPSGDEQSGFHLRRITPVIDPAVPAGSPLRQFDLTPGTSWGRFSLLPTFLAMHSNGYVVGVNPDYPTMQILQLPAEGTPDAGAPWAYLPLGPGTREGLVQSPALVTITSDQTILVLEAGNQRIQAFSRGGHPVAAFEEIETPYWIPLALHADSPADVTYLSLSVEVKGYIYVLSQNGLGYRAEDFNLDIYTPGGKHLVYQQGLVAAALVVDLWRNLYTLNFQQILGPGDRTEPSVSEWIPSTQKPQ